MTLKLLIVFFVVLAVWWSMRTTRREDEHRRAPGRRPPAVAHEAMVECAHCHVHLPQSEAVHGRGGGDDWFCGEPHRALHERVARS